MLVLGEFLGIANPSVTAERHVETAALVEPAQPVIPGSIEVVEQLGGFRRVSVTGGEELVETNSGRVVRVLVVFHRYGHGQPGLQPAVEADQVRVDVVQQCALGHQAKRHSEATAEGFDEPAPLVLRP